MGQELVRRQPGIPVPMGFGKQLRATNGHHFLERLEEHHRAQVLAERIDNACYLGERGMIGLTNLNQLGTALAADNAGLELELRHIEEGVAIGIRNTIVNYISGR